MPKSNDHCEYSLTFNLEDREEGIYSGEVLIELSEEIDAGSFEFEIDEASITNAGSIVITFRADKIFERVIPPGLYD